MNIMHSESEVKRRFSLRDGPGDKLFVYQGSGN
jgi:hypothetical protein